MASITDEDDSVTGGTTGQVTVSAAAGDTIVVCMVARNGATHTGITDDRSETYNPVTTPVADGASRTCIYYAENVASGTHVITGTVGAADTVILWAGVANGMATSSVLVNFDTQINSAVTTHPHGDTGISVAAGDLIITAAGQASTITDEVVSGSYTAAQNSVGGNNRQWFQYRIAVGALSNEVGAYTASSHSSGCMIASFAAAAAGGGAAILMGQACL